MENYNNGKRLRENDEFGESSLKKLKSELNDKNDRECNENNDESQQQNDLRSREEEELHFLRLFTHVLDTIIGIKGLDNAEISESIQFIKASFYTGGDPIFHTIDFTQWKNICGYLYRWSSHGAGFARNRILNAIRNCEVVENILRKPNLRVIFLGSGPGNDAVGLCSALSELQYPKSLRITLVDKFKEWSLCIKLIEILIKEGNFGKSSKLFEKTNVELSFVQTDLPGSKISDKKYFEILPEADVIVLSKLVSSLDRSNYGEHEITIIESLHKCMKEDAVILLNDEYMEDRWWQFRRIYSWGKEKENEYWSTAMAGRRFNSWDNESSKLPINVLSKN